MAFSKDQYWLQRKADKAFRESWYEWRKEMKELWTPAFVNYNKDMFTQKAFMNYLKTAADLEAKAEQDKVQELLLSAEAPEQVESPLLKYHPDNVVVTDLAPDSTTNTIVL